MLGIKLVIGDPSNLCILGRWYGNIINVAYMNNEFFM